MAKNEPTLSELTEAFEELVSGNSTTFSGLTSDSPIAFATVMIAFLGLLVEEKFGPVVSKSDLAEYAKSVHGSRKEDGVPTALILESALRGSVGEIAVLEQSQSEEFYEAIGLLVRSTLDDLNLTDESRASLLLKAEKVLRRTLAAIDDEGLRQKGGW